MLTLDPLSVNYLFVTYIPNVAYWVDAQYAGYDLPK